MTNAQELVALAGRFFDAIERGSIEGVRAAYAPDAVIWHNTDMAETTTKDNLEVLASFVSRIKDRRYEKRRVETFADGFIQQHILTGTRRDGVRLQLPACVVCKVKDGRIVRLDEYFDSAHVAPWMQ